MSDHLLYPEKLPRRSQRWALRLLAIIGWQVHFAPLPGPRGVIIVYPHTSNWDFPIGVMAKLGGEPIERHASTGAIERIAQHMRDADWFWLALAPEGTRNYRANWRTGFYHIAMAAKVPLAIAYIDYATRVVGVVDHLDLSGDIDGDMERIRTAYAGRQGLRPDMAAPITLTPPK